MFESPDDFLYSVDNELYYKAPDAGKVRLSDDYSNAVFAPYYGEPAEYVPDKRFLLVERKTEDDGMLADSDTLYDQEIGKDKVKIISADPGSEVIDPAFGAVCFADERKAVPDGEKRRQVGGTHLPVRLCDGMDIRPGRQEPVLH